MENLTKNIRTILILEPSRLVALDLVEAVQESEPDARLVVVANVDEAMRALRSIRRVDLAFVGLGQSELKSCETRPFLLDRLKRTVLTNGEAPAGPLSNRGWMSLPRPFSPSQIAAHLTSVGA